MKAEVTGFLFVMCVSGVGLFFLIKSSQTNSKLQSSQNINMKVTKDGRLKVVTPPGDDYTHLLVSTEGYIKLNSYKVKLKDYEGKTVQDDGQYSGNTLFVDSIK